jgi:hypothetical protein
MNSTIEERTVNQTEPNEKPLTLLPEDFAAELRRRWDQIQISFVDDPRTAVQQADDMVGAAIDKLSQSFTDQKQNLEGQWARGSDVSTEELRLALRRYRSFFQRLIAM